MTSERQQDVLRAQITELKREVTALEHQLSVEKAATEAERRRTTALQEQLKEREAHPRDSSSPRSSPTLSFGRVSLSESLSSNVWPQVRKFKIFCLLSFENNKLILNFSFF